MHVLAFFAASDGIVLENLAVRFMAGAPPSRRPAFLLPHPCLWASVLSLGLCPVAAPAPPGRLPSCCRARVAARQTYCRARVAGLQSCCRTCVGGPPAPRRECADGGPPSLQAPAAGADAQGGAPRRRAGARGARVLWLPDRDRERAQRNVQPAAGALYPGRRAAAADAAGARPGARRARARPPAELRAGRWEPAPGAWAPRPCFSRWRARFVAERGICATPHPPRLAACWGAELRRVDARRPTARNVARAQAGQGLSRTGPEPGARARAGHPHGAVRGAQGGVGTALDRQRPRLRHAPGRLCVRGGHPLLGILLRHLLAQEARADAGADVLQRAHIARRGLAHRLRLPAVRPPAAPRAAGAPGRARGAGCAANVWHMLHGDLRRAPRSGQGTVRALTHQVLPWCCLNGGAFARATRPASRHLRRLARGSTAAHALQPR